MTLNPFLRRTALLLTLGLVVLLGFAPSTVAQGRRMLNPEQMAAQRDTLLLKLDVTDEQRAPVLAILEEADQKRVDLMTAARESGSFMGVREDMAALQEETETKLGAVLTEAQMATYKTIQEERAARRRQRRGGR